MDLLPQRPATRDPSLVLFLSLNLLLLAFFVLINSLSERDMRRVNGVLGGVKTTFRGEAPGGFETIALRSDPDAMFASERLNLGIGRVLATGIPLAVHDSVGSGTLQRVTAPLDSFAAGGFTEPSQAREALLAAIAALLREPPQGWRYEVEIVLPRSAGIAAVVDLGRDLVARGAPARSVAVALDTGAASEIAFNFSARPVSP